MRCEDRFLLIDLDASSVVGEGFAASKVSSAYAPPELVYVRADGSAAVKMSSASSLADEYELVRSHYSQDVWALGCTLFELFTGSKMFLTVRFCYFACFCEFLLLICYGFGIGISGLRG